MNSQEVRKNYGGSFAILTLLFFMWGFITVMNDLLVNTFKEIFSLSAFESSMVQVFFFGAFFVISILYFIVSNISGDPINRIGYKLGMIIGLLTCGLGCMLFYPAAQLESYSFFLGALFVLATGVTILQIAANPYAAILGSPESASSRLNFAQGFNSLGTTLGPLVGAYLIFYMFSDGVRTPESVGLTYVAYGVAFFVCAGLLAFSKLPAFRSEKVVFQGLGALKFDHLILGAVAVFLYVGAEVAAGTFLVNFLEEPNVVGMPQELGNRFLSYYWGGLMIGRLMGAVSLSDTLSQMSKWLWMALISIGGFLLIYFVTAIDTKDGAFSLELLSFSDIWIYLAFLVVNYLAFLLGKNAAARSLMVFAVINVVLLSVAALSSGPTAMWTCIAVGLFNSIMWSNIFTLAIRGLGRYTSQGSSLLIMAIVGGALIPPLQGLIADMAGDFQISYLLPAICYLYIAWYGFWSGRKVVATDPHSDSSKATDSIVS